MSQDALADKLKTQLDLQGTESTVGTVTRRPTGAGRRGDT